MICRDLDAIRRWQPDVIILDEAQRIKNWKTRTAQTVKQLDSKYAIVLTGTPLENRLEELHSIVEFVDRFRLGPMFRFLDKHQHVNEGGRVVGYRNLSRNLQDARGDPHPPHQGQGAPGTARADGKAVLRADDEGADELSRGEPRDRGPAGAEVAAATASSAEADQLRMRIALQNMRMSCNSTYLLDKKTDHGVKADELADLLAEVFEDDQAKVVVFSQWVRMHELVVRRLERRKWEHVFFHGGVPGPERKGLIHRFKEDPACRLFLATDAGGVGLNLQNASAVVNLDQPWNPAVLEQRIGRVHRLGQHRPVRVVDFIAQGTIEEGMLSLLAFKKSMFAGVLDAGQDEVFMGGTRLKKFMESVEKATGSIPASMPQQPEHVPAERSETVEEMPDPRPSSHAPKPITEPGWSDLLTAALSFLEKLSQTFGAGGPHASGGLPSSLVARDDATGQSYLKLPLPDEGTMRKIVDLLSVFTAGR